MILKSPNPESINKYIAPPFSESQEQTLKKWLGFTLLHDQHKFGYPILATLLLTLLYCLYMLIIA